MQTGYTKNMCFMCLWDTRYKGDQYNKRDWDSRGPIRLRKNNIVETPLVPIEDILLPPLHIKLEIVKKFIKALDREGDAFNELRRIFPRLSGMKIKEGILNGPDIRRLIKDRQFEDALSEQELVAWACVKAVIQKALGGQRSEDWRIHIEKMITAFHRLGVSMSLKIHFMHCHVEKFAQQSPAESDQHGERFHQVTASLEHWYSGKKLDSLLGDICWNLQQEIEETEDDD